MMEQKAEIGIFGGSGFYTLAQDLEEIKVETPFGSPSDKVALGEINGRKVAFLPRHGKDHRFPPHMINFRANLWAMKELGVTRIIAPSAAGSLQTHIKPGEFVVCDQFVDRTSGRKDTFYDGPFATHVSPAECYCPELRKVALQAGQVVGINSHEKGTVVVIQGPRFSTKAESKWFTSMGWEVINMTQYPEAMLARELGICYVNISLITDYDAGLIGDHIEPVSADEVVKTFNRNINNLKKMLSQMIKMIPAEHHCNCAEALKNARLG
jgi:5'-methylthioadenosine phosphorylase